MTRKTVLSLLTLALIPACAESSTNDTEPQILDEQGDGVYRYVLGYDEEGGQIIGGDHQVIEPEPLGKTEAINDTNRAGRLHPELAKADYLEWDADLRAGKTDWDVFASYWWPQSKNGTANRWQPGANQDLNDRSDTDTLSPTEKYDLMFHPGQEKQVDAVEHCEFRDAQDNPDDCEKISHPELTVAGPATKWELENQGTYQRFEPENWWGHCNGWASYATAEPLGYPKRDVRVRVEDGKVVECTDDPEAEGCMLWRMADIEALMTELYFSDQATFTGSRCNTSPDDIERDEFGRPTDARCRDLNPGSFHIALVGLFNRGAENLVTGEEGTKPAFVIDHNYDHEIWNFPVVSYEINESEEVTKEQAAGMVGVTEASEYQFNKDATKFVRVKLTYEMVSDSVPANKLLLKADERGIALHPVELNYVLELDDTDRILGGEWIEEPSASVAFGENSKELHPDFAWMALDPIGFGESQDDTGGSSDNPHISYPSMQAILACANDPETCTPGDVTDPGDGGGTGGGLSCVGHCGSSSAVSDGNQKCFCDDVCTGFGDCCSDFHDVCGG